MQHICSTMKIQTQVHFAAQYLAMAGKSFLEPKSDDSHTNIGFNTQTGCFETWTLNTIGVKLLLDLNVFSLKWDIGNSPEIMLAGKSHTEVLHWLIRTSKGLGLNKPYQFGLHYDLPFSWNDNYTFEFTDKKALNEIIQLRKLANSTIENFLNSENLKSDIRVWPHHFDTGAFVVLNDGSGKSIGLGMAIPDSVVPDHYFYISGYKGHNGLDTSHFKKLSKGEWKNNGFKGAVLAVSNHTEKEILYFLEEAFSQYSNS